MQEQEEEAENQKTKPPKTPRRAAAESSKKPKRAASAAFLKTPKHARDTERGGARAARVLSTHSAMPNANTALKTLPRSRSGRSVKPPMAYWANQVGE